MSSRLEDFESQFGALSIERLVMHVMHLSAPHNINELVALFGRFVDIAFVEDGVSNATRALAAVWARAMTSVIWYSFEGHPREQYAFAQYQEHYAKLVLEHGYGTAMFCVRNHSESLMRIFDGEVPEVDTKNRRAFLLDVAFGRTEDDEK